MSVSMLCFNRLKKYPHATYICYLCRWCKEHCHCNGLYRDCDKCKRTYHCSSICAECLYCWECCEHQYRLAKWGEHFGIIIERCNLTYNDIRTGTTCKLSTVYINEGRESMDWTAQWRNTKTGSVETFTERDIPYATFFDWREGFVADLVKQGYEPYVYTSNRGGGKQQSDKDYVTTDGTKQIPCQKDDCDGKVYLRQNEKGGKKSYTLLCDKYNWADDHDNVAGHTNKYIPDVTESEASLKTNVKSKSGKQLTAHIPLPEFGKKQSTCFEAGEGGDDTDDIPF